MRPRTPRNRASDDSDIYDVSYYWAGNPGHLYTPSELGPEYRWSAYQIIEVFNDFYAGKSKKTGKYPISPCSHVKYDYHRFKDYQPWIGDNNKLHTPVDVWPNISQSVVDSLVPQDFSGEIFEQLNEDAFISFSTQFPQKLSFAEFVVGLRDLKDLLPKFEDSISKNVAGLYLQQKFGWDNLFSDLKALGSLMSSVQSRLDFLRKSYGKPTRIGFYKADVLEAPNLGHYTDSYPVRAWGTRTKLTGYRCDVRYTATLLQRLEHLNDSYGLFRGFVGALGLDNPLKAVWENLPFSFVVDWFGRVSTHLDRLAKVHPGEQWDVYDIIRTRKESARLDVIQVNDGTNMFPNPNPEILLGYISYDRYVRALGLPIGLGVYTPGNLSPDQLTLFLALLAANQK